MIDASNNKHFSHPFYLSLSLSLSLILLPELVFFMETYWVSKTSTNTGAFIVVTMEEGTRSKTSTERWEDAFAKLSSSISSRFDELLQRMTQLETSQTPQGPSLVFTAAPSTSMSSLHRLKLEVPRFDGTDPAGWIFKISQFFEYHATPDHERLTIASFYMEGKALAWFQWMYRNGQLTSWPSFLHTLHTRFSSSTYEDPTCMLCKLTQQSSVAEYLAKFESLANCVIRLSAPFVLSCFVSGISPAIRREVQVMQPQSLTQAVSFARLHEEKLMDGRFQNTRVAKLFPSQPSTPPTMSLEPSLLQGATKPSPPTIPFKRLSPAELALHREKGLCFNCDEKFSRGHKCTTSLFLFVTNEEEVSQESLSTVSGVEEPPA